MATARTIYRYPVKGLTGEPLESAEVAAGGCIPLDRAFAIAHATAPFDPDDPQPLPKTHFLMLMRNERLAALTTRYDEASGMLRIERSGRPVAQGNLGEPVGRKLIEQFFAAYLGDAVRGAPRLVQAPGHSFADCGAKRLSLIGLASLADLERVVQQPVDPLRFRANVYFDQAAPWEEFGWIGRRLRLGTTVLRVIKRIQRCAAVDVDPATGRRDLNLPRTLQSAFDHLDLGVYAEVDTPGRFTIGDALVPL